MKSIKRGRGPSFMGGIGNVFACVFGVFWTIMAYNIGAPLFFCAFGVMFIALGAISAIYNFKNATGKNRFSEFDIMDESEEKDPLNDMFGGTDKGISNGNVEDSRFCPYCGAAVLEDFEFCNKCGKKLP